MAESSKPAVPKFSSFKPKSAPAKNASPEPTAKGNRQKEERKDKHKDRRRDRDRDEDERRHKSRDKERRQERDHVKKSSTSQSVVKADSSDLAIRTDENGYVGSYRIDTTGDVSNLKYGSLHRYSIPAYRRSGYGNVMGAGTRAKIDRFLSDEKGIVVDAPESSKGNKKRPFLKVTSKNTRSLRLIRSDGEVQRLDHDQDFLALLPSRKRKRGSESPIPEDGEVDYRSIEGKAKESNQPHDVDLEYLTDSSHNTQNAEMEVAARRVNAQLFRRTRDDPHDLTAWLQMVEHQAALLGFMPNEDLSNSEQWTLAEMRLSIYEDALRAIGNDIESRTTLELGLLEEGAKVWEASRLSKRWENVARANKVNIRICIAYLDFTQTSFANFEFEKCKSIFLECMQNLNTQLTVRPVSRANTKAIVYIFLRLTNLMREAGYHEFSEALWQAVLELQFFRPATVHGSLNVAFEDFWESEVARIGEIHAKGWSNFDSDTQETPEAIKIMLKPVGEGEGIFKRFAHAEKTTAQHPELVHAGRSSDDTGEDDPFHMVLFRDIEPILFPAMLDHDSPRDLVPAFLLFLGMPLPEITENRGYDAWELDPFLTTITHRTPGSKDQGCGAAVKHRRVTTEVLFTDAFTGADLSDPDWVRRALQNLVDTNPEDDLLAEYFLAFEYYTAPATAAKSAKRLLKKRPHSLRLYNAYAIIQSRLKGLADGNEVFVKTLGMATSLDALEQNNTILLWRTWVFEALRIDVIPETIRRLLCVGTNKINEDIINDEIIPQFTPGNVLRTKKFLAEGRDGMLSTGLDHLAVLHIELLALFTYFSSSETLQPSLDVYTSSSSLFKLRKKEHSPAHEHLHQARAALLALHQQRAPFLKPSIMRDCLVESVTLFPNNTIFLTAYTNNEKCFKLDDRVRAVLSNIVLHEKNDTVLGWSFAIWSERQRGIELGGTSHAIRAVFDKAVKRSGKHSIQLWTKYFLFEIEMGDKTRAKQVFFRGLTNLPWSKWFIMLAFEYLDGEMGFEEMRRIWRVLGEKGFRIVIDIQDQLDDMAEEVVRRRGIE
ncbi:hypothetical protein BLS_000958 [Venturia inaequalis]|uniref:DUF1740-domain-containing protein n=1 Tax=Venturia inaequalis TaxID=5025 RepID=A0A8H3Z8M2_VENIN|nr:hypothetical protein BLS_000958 [Venturia inaequalis]KAE9987203.1 hypothetical protein EG327_003977 [Venturia inaequalis]